MRYFPVSLTALCSEKPRDILAKTNIDLWWLVSLEKAPIVGSERHLVETRKAKIHVLEKIMIQWFFYFERLKYVYMMIHEKYVTRRRSIFKCHKNWPLKRMRVNTQLNWK